MRPSAGGVQSFHNIWITRRVTVSVTDFTFCPSFCLFCSLTSLTSAGWTSVWTTVCGTSGLRTRSTGTSGSTPSSCTGWVTTLRGNQSASHISANEYDLFAHFEFVYVCVLIVCMCVCLYQSIREGRRENGGVQGTIIIPPPLVRLLECVGLNECFIVCSRSVCLC